MKKNYIRYAIAGFLVLVGIVCLFPRAIIHAGDASTSDTGVDASSSTHTQESTQVERNQQSLLKGQPLPSAITWSNERQNLIDKLKFEAKQGQVGYVALIGPMGQLVAYYTIQGKVSSLNSYLTTTEQSIWQYDNGVSGVTVDSPDLDGTYGVNPDGIFFFTTTGRYVEWSGNYLFSDQPMNYVTQPLLVSSGK